MQHYQVFSEIVIRRGGCDTLEVYFSFECGGAVVAQLHPLLTTTGTRARDKYHACLMSSSFSLPCPDMDSLPLHQTLRLIDIT